MIDIILSVPPNTNITQLILEFSHAHPGSQEVFWVLSFLKWKQLEELGLNKLGELKLFKIKFSHNGSPTGNYAWADAIERRLAGWENRRALQVEGGTVSRTQ